MILWERMSLIYEDTQLRITQRLNRFAVVHFGPEAEYTYHQAVDGGYDAFARRAAKKWLDWEYRFLVAALERNP